MSRLAAAGGSSLPAAIPNPAFVINLCASTTPMALPRPEHPELRRFTFFISRRREDGRERFRLHMGYFVSQEDAEQLLALVREIYPAAWAGAAPGQRLRAAAAAGAPEQKTGALPQPATAPQPTTTTPAAAAVTMAPDMSLAVDSLNSVRAAIDALDGSGPKPAPVIPPAAAPAPAERAVPMARSATPHSPAREVPTLSSSQTLRVLEMPAQAARPEVAGYAVQLLWSVQPIDTQSVPQLAIFSAYTIYGAAGSRDGRRWYGLRLGFFTDAVSAKQVANYVRSEFSAVSIVPISERERERALSAAARTALPQTASAAKKEDVSVAASGEFRLFEEDPAAREKASAAGVASGRTAPVRSAPGKRAKLRTPAPAAGTAGTPGRRAPLSLEETLEILGASEIKLQDGGADPANDSGVRHLRMEAIKGRRASRFSRLMDRLSERFSG